MKTRFFAACLFVVFTCSAFAADPCQDVALVELRTRSLSSMSESEKEYFLTKEKLCTELQYRALETKEPKVTNAPKTAPKPKPGMIQGDKASPGLTAGGIGGFLAGMAAFIFVLRIVTL